MLNKLISLNILKLLAARHDCSSIFGISILFIPGSKNHVGNLYVLYIFDFNTKNVIFSVLSHRPRIEDIEALIVKLDPPKDSLLVHENCSPFTKGVVTSLFDEHFKFVQKFESRTQFGYMFLFHRYLSILLTVSMEEYKELLKSQPFIGVVNFNYEEGNVVKFVDVWSSNLSGCLELVYFKFPNLKYIEELDMIELYDFDVEIIKKSDVEVLEHLFPKEKCSVNNKLVQSIYCVLKTRDEINNIGHPYVILVSVLAGDSWFSLRKSLIVGDDMDLKNFLKEFQVSLFKGVLLLQPRFLLKFECIYSLILLYHSAVRPDGAGLHL